MVAIHQPNLFPRLSTLAKLFAADHWIILDDVQFARRDYQHRTRLARLDNPEHRQWMSLSTHLPHGRPTLVRQARLAEPVKCRDRLFRLIQQYYGRSPHWDAITETLDRVLDRFAATDHTADIAEESTRALLDTIDWSGTARRSSALPARPERSQRLADLTAAVGSTSYLCGTGGMRYLDVTPFTAQGIGVIPFTTPVPSAPNGVWQGAREVSSLWALATVGPHRLTEELRHAVTRPE